MRVLFFLIFFFTLSPNVLAQSTASDQDIAAFFTHSTPMTVTFILSVTAIKITAFVIGYLIVRLGHDTLIKGVTGDIDFGLEGKGLKTKLKAGSPGAFFVLAGAAIILWGLFVSKPLNISVKPVSTSHSSVTTQSRQDNEPIPRGSLRPIPE
jgi:hypothetical protein